MKKSDLLKKFNRFDQRSTDPSDLDVNDRIMIVDATNQFIRIFATIKNDDDSGMLHAQGVMRFIRSLGYIVRRFRPTRCILVFDGYGGSVRRKKLYPEYKENRTSKIKIFENGDVDEAACFNRIIQYLEHLPVSLIILDGIEADDVIAYVTKECYRDIDNETIVVSSDKDFLQLVSDDVKVWSPVKKTMYTPEKVKEEYDIHPSNFIIYKIFEGDRSDNIKGVYGIGLKTLLKRFPYLSERSSNIGEVIDDARKKLDDGESLKVYETIDESEEQIYLNDELMRLEDLNISAHSKMKINSLVKDTSDLRMDYVTLKKMFTKEHARYYLGNDTRSWLDKSFKRLMQYAE